MSNRFSLFYEELRQSLPNSTGKQRKVWANTIVKENLSISKLSDLLLLDYKIASRFLWLLSDIGELNTNKLKDELVFLFDRCIALEHIELGASFANYWLICGVPEEKEGLYIDHLFTWLSSPDTNVTTKSRSLFVLSDLTNKYPEIRKELIAVITEQLDRNTSDFKKRALKVLRELE